MYVLSLFHYLARDCKDPMGLSQCAINHNLAESNASGVQGQDPFLVTRDLALKYLTFLPRKMSNMKKDNSLSSFCMALVVTTVIVPGQPNEFCVANASSSPLLVQSSDRTQGHEHGIFEAYDNSKNARMRKERLDAFADHLKENPHFQGYIMSYGGRRTFVGEAKVRGQSAKNYLVKSKGIRADRVTIIDAGYRESWVIQLWFGVAGGSNPVPLPTIDKNQVIIRARRS